MTNQAYPTVSAVITQLQSENQQIKTDIYKIVHGITDICIPDELTSPEWYWILTSCVETQILQSNCDELEKKHMNSSREITADLYAEMVRGYNNLRRLYEQALKSHAALQDGHKRFTRQLTSFSVHPSLQFVVLINLTILAAQ